MARYGGNSIKWNFFALSLFLSMTLIPAHSKDLTGHFGIGFNQPLKETPPAVDVKVALTQALAVGAGIAIDTKDAANSLAIGGKVYRNAFTEENSNFYLGMSLYFVTVDPGTGTTSNGLLLGGFIGNEFFFQELPRLGLSFEAGFAVETVNKVRFRTDAASFAQAGIHYYF